MREYEKHVEISIIKYTFWKLLHVRVINVEKSIKKEWYDYDKKNQ